MNTVFRGSCKGSLAFLPLASPADLGTGKKEGVTFLGVRWHPCEMAGIILIHKENPGLAVGSL